MEKEVSEFKQFGADDPHRKTKALIHIVREFGDDFMESIEGRGNGDIDMGKLSGTHGHMASGVLRGRRRLQGVCPVGWPPLKRP
jgi:hypothetical protein